MTSSGEPMDIAFRLLKMPLLPESVKEVPATDSRSKEFIADFEHPETGEIYPMQGYANSDEAGTFIYPPNKLRPKESPPLSGDNHSLAGAIAEATFSPQSDYASDANEWTGAPYIRERDPFAEGNEFGEEAPPVGMGTAMYDLAAMMADKHGAKIVPSAARSHQAHNMWAKHEDKGHWPVRTGEPMDIAMRLLKALREQQMTHRGSQKRGTIHPAILGYLSRRDDDPDLEVGRGRLRPLHPRRDFTRPSSPGAYGLSHALEKPGWGWDTHTQVPTSGQDIRTLAPPSFSPQESIDIEHGWLPDHYKSKVFLEGEN